MYSIDVFHSIGQEKHLFLTFASLPQINIIFLPLRPLCTLVNDWRAGTEQAFLVVLTFKLFFVSFSDYSSCVGKTDGRVGLAKFLQGRYRKKPIKCCVSIVIGVPFKREGCIDKVFTMGCS